MVLIIGGDAKADAVDVAKRSSDQQKRVRGFFMLGCLVRLRIIIEKWANQGCSKDPPTAKPPSERQPATNLLGNPFYVFVMRSSCNFALE
jgi:hypothetical protein